MAIKILPKLLTRDLSNRIITGNITGAQIATKAECLAAIGFVDGYLDGDDVAYLRPSQKDDAVAAYDKAYVNRIKYTIPKYDVLTRFYARTESYSITSIASDTCLVWVFIEVTNNSGATLLNVSTYDYVAGRDALIAHFDSTIDAIYADDIEYPVLVKNIQDGETFLTLSSYSNDGMASFETFEELSVLGGGLAYYTIEV